MPNDPNTYLHDIRQAARYIATFTEGNSYADYEQDRLLSSAVERQLQIIGEALAQLDREAPEIASRIPEYRRVIAFRNVLVHGYASLDNRLVWGVIEAKLPQLSRAVGELLEAAPE